MSEWIKKLADDIKEKDAAAVTEAKLQLHRTEVIKAHGPLFFEGFYASVNRDLEKLRADLNEDITAGTIQLGRQNNATFSINRPAFPFIQATVALNIEGNRLVLNYAKFNPERPPSGFASQSINLSFDVTHHDHVFLALQQQNVTVHNQQITIPAHQFHHPDEAAKWLIELLFSI